jgi:hypothetical protein
MKNAARRKNVACFLLNTKYLPSFFATSFPSEDGLPPRQAVLVYGPAPLTLPRSP